MRTAVGKVLTPVSRRGTEQAERRWTATSHGRRSVRPWSPSRVLWPAAACGDVLTHRWTNPPSPRRPPSTGRACDHLDDALAGFAVFVALGPTITLCWSGRGRVVPGHRPTESQPGTHLVKGIPMRRWAACLATAPGAAIRDAIGGRHRPGQRPEGEP